MCVRARICKFSRIYFFLSFAKWQDAHCEECKAQALYPLAYSPKSVNSADAIPSSPFLFFPSDFSFYHPLPVSSASCHRLYPFLPCHFLSSADVSVQSGSLTKPAGKPSAVWVAPIFWLPAQTLTLVQTCCVADVSASFLRGGCAGRVGRWGSDYFLYMFSF